MPWSGLEPSEQTLGQAAQTYFVSQGLTSNSDINIHKEIAPAINWRPTIWFKGIGHTIIAVEDSPEAAYPMALRINASSIRDVHIPITIYTICPEIVFLNKQTEVKELRKHGFGLLTSDGNGSIEKQFGGHPLIQHISEEEFQNEIKGLPKSIVRELRIAYETYNSSPTSGVANLGEIVEGACLSAKKAIIKKGWSSNNQMGNTLADHFNCMTSISQMTNAISSVSRMRGFVAVYRNTAAHRPKSRKQAYQKYNDCQHAFREGIKALQYFTGQLKNLGISIRI